MKLSELLQLMHDANADNHWIGKRGVSNSLTALAAIDHLRGGRPFAALLVLQGEFQLSTEQIHLLIRISSSSHDKLPEQITALRRVGL